MVNDIIEELLDLDIKPESLWWTSTYQAEDRVKLKVLSRSVWSLGVPLPSLEAPEELMECCAKVWATGGETAIFTVPSAFSGRQSVTELSATSSVQP